MLVLMTALSCRSAIQNDKHHADSADTNDVVFVDALENGDDITPDLTSIYLSGIDISDQIAFLDTSLNLSDELINRLYTSIDSANQRYFASKEGGQDIALRVKRVNMGFQEYLWYKRLRSTYPKNSGKDRSCIAILVRNGQSTTIRPDLLDEQLDTFPEDFKNTKEWKDLKNRLKPKEVIGYSIVEQGKADLITPQGSTIKLKDLVKGEDPYIVLAVTASWCAPCQQEYEYFKSSFDDLANQYVRLISYSLDTKPESWRKLLNKKNYIAECYCDLQGFQSGFIKDMAIHSIPTYLLIDGKGVVQGKYSRNVTDLFNKISDSVSGDDKNGQF